MDMIYIPLLLSQCTSFLCSVDRFMLNISLRFENFIMLRAFEEGKWHVKLMELICHPPSSRFLFVIRVLKIKWKKRFKKRFSAPILIFFIYLIPLQHRSEKGAQGMSKRFFPQTSLRFIWRFFLSSVLLAKSFLSIWKKAPFILFHSAFLFTVLFHFDLFFSVPSCFIAQILVEMEDLELMSWLTFMLFKLSARLYIKWQVRGL